MSREGGGDIRNGGGGRVGVGMENLPPPHGHFKWNSPYHDYRGHHFSYIDFINICSQYAGHPFECLKHKYIQI